MRTLYLDPVSGIAGDMFLGMLVDLGLDPHELKEVLQRLPLQGWDLEAVREKRQGIEGVRVNIQYAHEKHHRTWTDIDAMLAQSALEPEVIEMARRIFRRLGEAEARVHGMPLEKVHFHEVGAVDSILDITGAAWGLHRLAIERVVCAPLPLSRGTVETAHGRYPLPAPATAEALQGCPVIDADSTFELVTPTGASIAAAAAAFGPLPAMTLEKTGYGVGSRDLPDRPNVLRGMLGVAEGKLISEVVSVLETHLDDANPEWMGALMEQLLQAGALDVAYSALQMKKNRPGIRVTVIAPPEKAQSLAFLLMRESSSIGVRRYETQRYSLRRKERTIATPVGEARIKIIYEGEKVLRITPEYDSCLALARASGHPLPTIYRLVTMAAEELFSESAGRE